jgi:hypothetical protein
MLINVLYSSAAPLIHFAIPLPSSISIHYPRVLSLRKINIAN